MWALVNNGGISVNAPVEAFAISEWRRLFEVNLFGHVAVTQVLLPPWSGSCPTAWCRSGVSGQRWLCGQAASGGRLTVGSSLSGAMVSRVM